MNTEIPKASNDDVYDNPQFENVVLGNFRYHDTQSSRVVHIHFENPRRGNNVSDIAQRRAQKRRDQERADEVTMGLLWKGIGTMGKK